MAFLDQKERVLDIVLTDRGRELLAQNQLNFVYFAFSDEGVDYSGSLSASSLSSSYENMIFRNLSFEADQRRDFYKDRDLSSYLYTIPIKEEILPEFKINVNTGSVLNLERRFFVDTIYFQNRPRSFVQKPIDVILRVSVPQKTPEDREQEYVHSQRIRELRVRGEDPTFNAAGFPVGKNLTLISPSKVLDQETGNVLPLRSPQIQQRLEEQSLKVSSVKQEAEYVLSVDKVKVEFLLANSKGPLEIDKGFLIEVFDSGSDGRLTRLYREDLVDAVSDETLSDGFYNFIRLGVDLDG